MNKESLKILSYESSISGLPDYPSDEGISAARLKELFDARSDGEIKEKHNALVDAYAETEAEVSVHFKKNANPHNVTKAQIGLSKVDNTSDMDKPISNAAKNKFDEILKQVKDLDDFVEFLSELVGEFEDHSWIQNNPHGVTKAQVGLSNVDNTSDADKPISEKTRRYVDDLNWKNAPKKECEYSKEHTLSDSFDGVFAKISLRGESFQNEPPSISNHVEIESVKNPTITVKSSASDAEETVVTLNGIELRGIMHYDNYWLAQDELLMSDGKVKLIRKCGIIEDASALAWIEGDTTGVYYAEIDALRTRDWYGSSGFCTAYRYAGVGITNAFNIGSNQIVNGDKSYIVFNTSVATLEEFKSSVKNQKIVYRLQNPTETDITDTEVGKALCSLCTKYPGTYILSDAEMAFTYAMDIVAFFNGFARTISSLDARVRLNEADIQILREDIERIEQELLS